MRSRAFAAAVVAALIVAAPERPRAQPSYSIKDLGTLGGLQAKAMAVSEKGHVWAGRW